MSRYRPTFEPRGRPSRSKSGAATSTTSIKLTPDEHRAWKRAAGSGSLASLIREAVELQIKKRSRSKPIATTPEAFTTAIARIKRLNLNEGEQRAIAVALEQLARDMRERRDGFTDDGMPAIPDPDAPDQRGTYY